MVFDTYFVYRKDNDYIASNQESHYFNYNLDHIDSVWCKQDIYLKDNS